MFDGENFDEFDKLKLHRQKFPYQYFTNQFKHLYTCNINGSRESVYV